MISTAFVAVTSVGISLLLLAGLYFVIYLICKAVNVIEKDELDDL